MAIATSRSCQQQGHKQKARDRTDAFRSEGSRVLIMILSTCCYVKKNAGLSFDELHSVVGVAKVGTSALPALADLLDADLFFRVVPEAVISLHRVCWSEGAASAEPSLSA